MRISDWSSDVCSSDLQRTFIPTLALALQELIGQNLQIQRLGHQRNETDHQQDQYQARTPEILATGQHGAIVKAETFHGRPPEADAADAATDFACPLRM